MSPILMYTVTLAWEDSFFSVGVRNEEKFLLDKYNVMEIYEQKLHIQKELNWQYELCVKYLQVISTSSFLMLFVNDQHKYITSRWTVGVKKITHTRWSWWLHY